MNNSCGSSVSMYLSGSVGINRDPSVEVNTIISADNVDTAEERGAAAALRATRKRRSKKPKRRGLLSCCAMPGPKCCDANTNLS